MYLKCIRSADMFHPVLHPRHKLAYFQHAGWAPDWITSVKKIVHDEFDHSYYFQDDVVVATGPEDHYDAASVKNMFNNLPAFHTVQYSTLNELTRYLTAMPEDMKNEDVLCWWYEHRHVYPNLHHMVLNYHTIPSEVSLLSSQTLNLQYLTDTADALRLAHLYIS